MFSNEMPISMFPLLWNMAMSENLQYVRSSPIGQISMHYINSGQVLPHGVPFPEGVRVGNLLFLSGVIGHIPGTWTLAPGGTYAETQQAISNLKAILEKESLGLNHVVRCTVMLADIAEWSEFNRAYVEAFGTSRLPARSAFGCNGLAIDARVEIECIASF